MFVAVSTVRATSAGVFEIEVSCSLCGHRAWARVRGEGTGQALGGTQNDYQRAQHWAGLDAHRDAIQKARGCPCPHCGGHDPQTITWASLAEQRVARRRWWRVWFGPVTLPFVPLGALGFAVFNDGPQTFLSVFGFATIMLGACWVLGPPVAFFAFAPRKEPAPRLYTTVPADVVFRG